MLLVGLSLRYVMKVRKGHPTWQESRCVVIRGQPAAPRFWKQSSSDLRDGSLTGPSAAADERRVSSGLFNLGEKRNPRHPLRYA